MEVPEIEEEIKSGILFKRESGLGVKWKEKWFVLYGKSLYWFKTLKDSKKKDAFKNSKSNLLLTNCQLRLKDFDPPCNDAPFKDNCFQVVTPDGTTVSICAPSDEEMQDWIEVVKSVSAGRRDLNKETVLIQEELRKAGQDIPPQDLEFADGMDTKDMIGQGASGVVKRGLWLKSTEVAVKALKNVPEFTDTQEMVAFYKEIETLSKLRHVNVVQMYGFCRKENYICLVTEFVRGGNLSECLSNKEHYGLDLPLQIELALNICRGMVYLHNAEVIHRDLKPGNILIESWEEGKVKVCDFGLSRVVKKASGDKKQQEETLGSPQYAAPELANEDHDKKVDVFSFSIILWEIAFREQPWPDIKFGSQFAERYQAGRRPDFPTNSPFKSIIAKCWAMSPAQRPTFVQVYEELEQLKRSLGDLGITRTVSSPPSVSRTMSQRGSTMSSMNGIRPLSSSSPDFRYGNSVMIQNGNNNNGSRTQSVRAPATTRANTGPSVVGTPLNNHAFNHSNSAPDLNVNPPATPRAPNALESQIWVLFQKNATCSWDAFCNTFQACMNATVANMEKIRYLFDKSGVVDQETWENFLVWFSPLCVLESIYQTSSNDNSNSDGYDIETIVDICSPSYFHGFLGSSEAQKMLKGKPDGTFLLRFSTSNPGSYALSVAYTGTVGHWRIQCDKPSQSTPSFKIDNREYKSLDHIVNTHKFGREPLKIKQPRPGQPNTCYLGTPFNRTAQGQPEVEEFYQNVGGKRV